MGDQGSLIRVCVATATRAEYHLLCPLMKAFAADEAFDLRVVATGSHLVEEYGMTYKAIEADGFSLDAKIPILDTDDSPLGTDRAFAAAAVGFGEYFARRTPDVLVVLGDRYEMLSIVFAAVNHGVAVAHIHGGEITEGAIDEVIRHAITKMSYLHFTSCESYRQRVIQLGEDPRRVFNVGALGVENIRTQALLTREELEASVGFCFGTSRAPEAAGDPALPLNPAPEAAVGSACAAAPSSTSASTSATAMPTASALITYHPTTRGDTSVECEAAALFGALDAIPTLGLLFTKANADSGGRAINALIEEYVAKRENALLVSSLGLQRYLSALAQVDVVIGNSSSGLLETAPFGVPTVNIGDRQKGRLRPGNVIDCEATSDSILAAITYALSVQGKERAATAENPYGDGFVSTRIVEALKRAFEQGIDRRKTFFDLKQN